MKNNLKVLCGLALIASVLGTSTVSCGKRENSSSSSNSDSTPPSSQTSDSNSSSQTSTTEKKVMLEKLVVDTNYAKVKFNKGEAFSSDGLILRAGYSTEGEDGIYYEKVSIYATGVVIDSSKYNKDEVGTYTISISYTFEKAIRYGEYEVSVVDEYDGQIGIDVSLEDDDEKIELSSTSTSADLSSVASKLVVKEVLADGSLATTALDASKYEVSYYKDGTKLDETSVSEQGVYQVWVKTTLTRDNKNFTVSNFALVYVINDVQSIAVKTDVGTFTQEQGKDVISSTWTYVATYANGTTKELTSEDVTIDIDTSTAGENKTATVTYEETNPLDEKVTKTTSVTYTITSSSAATTTYVYRFNPDSITGVTVGTNFTTDLDLQTVDKDGNTTDSVMKYITGKTSVVKAQGKQVTLTDGTIVTPTNMLQTGGATSGLTQRLVKLNLSGASVIDLYFSSTSSSKTVAASILNSEGTALTTSEKTNNTLIKTTFEVEKAGTYYLAFDNSANIYYIDITTTVENKTVRTAESYNISEYDPAFVKDTTVNDVQLGEFITFYGAVAKDKGADPYSKAWQLAKKLSADNNIKLDFSTLAEGEKATVKVKFASASSSYDVKRCVGFFSSTELADANLIKYETVAATTCDKTIVTLEYTFTKGTYYVGSFIMLDGETVDTVNSKGSNIFAISIDFE